MILAIFALLVIVFVVLPLIGMALWLVISTAVVGLVFGALGRLLVPGKQSIGILATMAIGVVGSIVGSILGHVFGLGGLGTLLLQIGAAAGGVALAERNGRSITGRNRSALR